MFLLDACLPQRFGELFSVDDFDSARRLGWAELDDAAILALSRGRFSAIVTLDRRFARASELTSDDPTIVLLRPRLDTMRYLGELVPKIAAALANLQPGTITEVRWRD